MSGLKICAFVRWYNLNVVDEVSKIRRESGYDTFLSLDYKNERDKVSFPYTYYYNEEDFNRSGMLSWGIVAKKPGSIFRYNPELSLIDFKNNFSYDYYWLIEGDVRFTGDYGSFFKEYEDNCNDLLAYNVVCDKDKSIPGVGFSDEPLFFTNNNVFNSMDSHFTAFMVVSRFSKRLLDAVESGFSRGILGTNENIVANICYMNNFKMSSFNRNYFDERFYSDSIKEFRPNEVSKFFHAIKR